MTSTILGVTIIGFDVPNMDAWGDRQKQHVVATLSSEPPERWMELFHAQVAARGHDIRTCEARIEKDQLIFIASRSNARHLCARLRDIVISTDLKLIKSRLIVTPQVG